MKHEQIKEALLLLRDTELPASEKAEIQAHLSVCDECRNTASRWDRLKDLLHQTPAPEPSEAFIFKVMERLPEKNFGPVKTAWAWPRSVFPAMGYAFALALIAMVLAPQQSYAVNVETVLISSVPQDLQWAITQEQPDLDSLWNLKEGL